MYDIYRNWDTQTRNYNYVEGGQLLCAEDWLVKDPEYV